MYKHTKLLKTYIILIDIERGGNLINKKLFLDYLKANNIVPFDFSEDDLPDFDDYMNMQEPYEYSPDEYNYYGNPTYSYNRPYGYWNRGRNRGWNRRRPFYGPGYGPGFGPGYGPGFGPNCYNGNCNNNWLWWLLLFG